MTDTRIYIGHKKELCRFLVLLQSTPTYRHFKALNSCLVCIVLYIYISIALLAVHSNQKLFHLHVSAAQMQWYCSMRITCSRSRPYTVTVSDEARTVPLFQQGSCHINPFPSKA